MNHPKPEDWVPYLYGESAPKTRAELKAHLDGCPQCRAEFAGWEQSVKRLDAWKLPRARRQGFLVAPILKWSTAAAALLFLGFIAGRSASARPDVERLRAALEPQLRQELTAELTRVIRQEVSQGATATLAQAQAQSDKAVAACSAALESKRAQDYRDVHAALLVLKEQLDTVAMNTDAGFRQAVQKLVQLADVKQPRSSPSQE
jgi:anti-sigma factor RsiW